MFHLGLLLCQPWYPWMHVTFRKFFDTFSYDYSLAYQYLSPIPLFEKHFNSGTQVFEMQFWRICGFVFTQRKAPVLTRTGVRGNPFSS